MPKTNLKYKYFKYLFLDHLTKTVSDMFQRFILVETLNSPIYRQLKYISNCLTDHIGRICFIVV